MGATIYRFYADFPSVHEKQPPKIKKRDCPTRYLFQNAINASIQASTGAGDVFDYRMCRNITDYRLYEPYLLPTGSTLVWRRVCSFHANHPAARTEDRNALKRQQAAGLGRASPPSALSPRVGAAAIRWGPTDLRDALMLHKDRNSHAWHRAAAPTRQRRQRRCGQRTWACRRPAALVKLLPRACLCPAKTAVSKAEHRCRAARAAQAPTPRPCRGRRNPARAGAADGGAGPPHLHAPAWAVSGRRRWRRRAAAIVPVSVPGAAVRVSAPPGGVQQGAARAGGARGRAARRGYGEAGRGGGGGAGGFCDGAAAGLPGRHPSRRPSGPRGQKGSASERRLGRAL